MVLGLDRLAAIMLICATATACGGGAGSVVTVPVPSPSSSASAQGVTFTSIAPLAGTSVDTNAAGEAIYPLLEIDATSASSVTSIASYGTVDSNGNALSITELATITPGQPASAAHMFFDSQQRPVRLVATIDGSAIVFNYLSNNQLLMQELDASGAIVASTTVATPTLPSFASARGASLGRKASSVSDAKLTVKKVGAAFIAAGILCAVIPGAQAWSVRLSVIGLTIEAAADPLANALDAQPIDHFFGSATQSSNLPYNSALNLPPPGTTCSNPIVFTGSGQTCLIDIGDTGYTDPVGLAVVSSNSSVAAVSGSAITDDLGNGGNPVQYWVVVAVGPGSASVSLSTNGVNGTGVPVTVAASSRRM
jgi:hypothetical protein